MTAAARQAAQAFIEDEDLWAGFLLLMRWTDRVDRGQSLFNLVAVMERRHGQVMQDLRTALVEYRREFSIGMRRRTLRDPGWKSDAGRVALLAGRQSERAAGFLSPSFFAARVGEWPEGDCPERASTKGGQLLRSNAVRAIMRSARANR